MLISDWSSDVCSSDLPTAFSDFSVHEIVISNIFLNCRSTLNDALSARDRRRNIDGAEQPQSKICDNASGRDQQGHHLHRLSIHRPLLLLLHDKRDLMFGGVLSRWADRKHVWLGKS